MFLNLIRRLLCIYWGDHILSSLVMWWNDWLILNFKNKDYGAGWVGQLWRAWERSPPGARLAVAHRQPGLWLRSVRWWIPLQRSGRGCESGCSAGLWHPPPKDASGPVSTPAHRRMQRLDELKDCHRNRSILKFLVIAMTLIGRWANAWRVSTWKRGQEHGAWQGSVKETSYFSRCIWNVNCNFTGCLGWEKTYRFLVNNQKNPISFGLQNLLNSKEPLRNWGTPEKLRDPWETEPWRNTETLDSEYLLGTT